MSVFKNKSSKAKGEYVCYYLNFSKILTYEWCRSSVSDVDSNYWFIIEYFRDKPFI